MTGLRMLSLWQPYASLVACGAKTWETRSYRTTPGRIGIAATIKPRPEEAAEVALPAIHDALWPALGFDRRPMPTCVRERLPRGVIVATAELVDCCPIGGPYSFRTGFVQGDEGDYPGQAVVVRQGAIGTLPASLVVSEADTTTTDITDQLPFGIWDPDRWGWRLADIKPTNHRCPWCWGERGDPDDEGWSHQGIVEPGSRGACPVCDGHGVISEVPVTGRQGLWTWRGEVRKVASDAP